jgi:hypothetical protein
MLHFFFNDNRKGTIGVVVLGVAFTILGAFLGYVGLDTYRDGKETESWTATSGRVLSSTVDLDTRTERRNGRTQTKKTYTPIVTYEYTVDGVRYEGDNIRADDHGGGSDRAYDIVGRYPQGAETTAYYNPDSPEDAVLVQGAESTQVYVFSGLGGLFGTIGLAVLGFIGVTLRRLNREYL